MKTLIRLLAGLSLAATCLASFAQTQTVPTPASSVDRGGRAVIAITMPPPAPIQSPADLLASANGGWSRFFVGTQRCVDTFPRGRPVTNCFAVQNDGSIRQLSGVMPGALAPGTVGYEPVFIALPALCQQPIQAFMFSPNSSASDITFGRPPSSWSVVFGTNGAVGPNCEGN